MTAGDHFRRFLELVPDTLDDPALTGEALAGRALLSRFHLDRLVSAAAGEPPGAFRRRLLLERAAHRLVASDANVLTIAVEAGYASHEAFTRAFGRAYGCSPSELRHAFAAGGLTVADLDLAAPSGVHFLPPGALRVPTTLRTAGRSSAMDLVIRMVDHHVWLVGEILARAGTLPAEVVDRPVTISVEGVDDDLTLRRLCVLLVAQEERWLAVSGGGEDEPSYDDATLGDLVERHARAGALFRGLAASVAAEDRLDDTVVDSLCDPPQTFTYGGVLAHVLTFAAHRRLLALGALASAGVTDLGSGDPRLWVAEPTV